MFGVEKMLPYTKNLRTTENQKQHKILEVKRVHHGVTGKMNKKGAGPRAFFGGRASPYIHTVHHCIFQKR